ncbi:hypothetical protein P7C71_g3987, partial [Lecanoromycetidae sp. Uapishka_2]
MATVQSNYTAAVRSQQLSASTQDLYRLVAKLAGYANGTDENHFTPTDASDAVRCIDKYVRETASDLDATSRDLSKVTEDTRLFRFHAALGDYPGHLCKVLKDGRQNSKISQQPWTIIVPRLDKEEESLNAWEASDKTRNRPRTPFLKALEERVNDLVYEGWNDVDLDLALFSVRAYARRCFVAHGDSFDLFASNRFADLADYIEADDKSLEAILPDEEKPLAGKYRRLLTIYRDRHIRQNDDGEWVKYIAPPEPPRSSLQSESAFRASLDLGRFRPAGLDGPPPVHLEADIAAYRRHSVAIPIKLGKRPAEGQPSGQPLRKVARGLDYPQVRPETTPDHFTEADFMSAAELHEQLHCLADMLNLVSPKDAKKLYELVVPQLERELKRVRASEETRMYRNARASWDSRYKKRLFPYQFRLLSRNMSTSTSNGTPPTPLRILMLHGFTQSSHLFHAKTRALHKSLTKAFPNHTLHLAYPQGPHKLALADIPGHDPEASDLPVPEAPEAYGWWRRKDHDDPKEIVYEGLEKGLGSVAECIRQEGPFDGVIGFSQGAAAAAMVASLLEGQPRKEAFGRAEKDGGIPFLQSFIQEGRDGVDGFVQGPLKFAVSYSGFKAPGKKYAGFYEPKIRTPLLHVLGQVDVVVDEVRGRQLVEVSEGGEENVVVHPGGHFVPSQKPWLDAVVRFIKECVEGSAVRKDQRDEESVEDMDVPF